MLTRRAESSHGSLGDLNVFRWGRNQVCLQPKLAAGRSLVHKFRQFLPDDFIRALHVQIQIWLDRLRTSQGSHEIR